MRGIAMYDERYYQWTEAPADLCLDYQSVYQHLEQLMGADKGRFLYMGDDLTNFANMAADLMLHIDRMIRTFSHELPPRIKPKDEIEEIGVYWFNAAAALSNRTNMHQMLAPDEDIPAQKRMRAKDIALRAVHSLCKEQHFMLIRTTYAILLEYLKIVHAVEVLVAIDAELITQNAYIKTTGGALTESAAAWVL